MTAAATIWREGRKGLLGRIAWEARAFLEAAGDDVLAGEVDGARLAAFSPSRGMARASQSSLPGLES
jgi:hypothetical protein